jgi:hypothetical protein
LTTIQRNIEAIREVIRNRTGKSSIKEDLPAQTEEPPETKKGFGAMFKRICDNLKNRIS